MYQATFISGIDRPVLVVRKLPTEEEEDGAGEGAPE